MGGIEDTEPPLKRLKVPSGVSENCLHSSSDNSSYIEPASCSSGDWMARPLSSQGDVERIGVKGLIKKHEYVKIITKALYSLGYHKTGALLQEESGVELQPSAVSLFMQQVSDGRWDESLTTLHTIHLPDKSIVKSASLLILEQKFFALLKKGKLMDAIFTLRNEVGPLSSNSRRVHELAVCVIAPSQAAILGLPTQDNDTVNSRAIFLEKLQKLFPPAVLIPERRLEHLLEQALGMQVLNCEFHNTLDSELSLLSDHHCGRDQIPSQTLQVLHAHEDEVWFLQFSHNGKYLASSSKDRSTIIWEVNDNGTMVLKHKLTGHQRPVSIVSWSPDDHQLLTCGVEEVIRRWDVKSGECLYVYERPGVGLVSCGWFPDSKGIISGMTDKSICLWDLDGRELECWKGRTINISDMAVTDDGKMILSICRETAILLLDREAKFEKLIEEEQVITSFSLSKDNKFLLVNLINQEIHLWSIEDEAHIISKYMGHTRTRFLIRSCFGGFQQAFIASGSEDSQVYIWYRDTGELLSTLPGHSGSVNCVSWNPVNPRMLASASDDRTIRIWGVDDHKRAITHVNGGVDDHKCASTHINGFVRPQTNGRIGGDDS